MKHNLIQDATRRVSDCSQFYLDYSNDWLTVEAYALYNQLSVDDTQTLINIGRMLHIKNTEG